MLSIVIVAFNNPTLIDNCISTIKVDFEFVDKIYVVDNSTDNLVYYSKNSKVIVIVVGKNIGFGAACNLGASQVKSDWILFLNPDTEMRDETLMNLKNSISSNGREYSILGAKLLDRLSITQRNCAIEPKFYNIINATLRLDKINPNIFPGYTMKWWDHEDSRPVVQVMGSFLTIKKNIFHLLGGFDERFFMYYEELDLCVRAKKLNYKCLYDSSITLFHDAGGISTNYKLERFLYNSKSKELYCLKHFSLFENLCIFPILYGERIIRLTKYFIIEKDFLRRYKQCKRV